MNRSQFPSTSYSLISQLQKKDVSVARPALELFVLGYRRALIQFLTRQKNVNEHDAEDLVQEFIVKKILSGKVIDLANGKGRFRNLLRKSLQNFFLDEVRSQKRNQAVFLDLIEMELDSSEAPFDQFDQAWAVGVFTAVLKQMKEGCEHWGVFADRVLTQPPISYQTIVQRYGYADPSQSSNALMTAKRTFNRLVEECMADNSQSADDIQSDLKLLKEVLSDSTLMDDVLASVLESKDSTFAHRHLKVNSTPRVSNGVIEDIAQEEWSDSDLNTILNQVISQRVSEFVKHGQCSDLVRDLIFSSASASSSELIEIQQLKRSFRRIHSGLGEFSKWPEEIGVTAVFLCDACYVARGGAVNEITSVSSVDLVDRLRVLSKNSWIPKSAKQLFGKAVDCLT